MPSNLCLVGQVGIDDNGELAINGTAITGNINAIYNLAPLNVAIPGGVLTVGSNTLALGWGSTDNSQEAFRLGATIQTLRRQPHRRPRFDEYHRFRRTTPQV